MMDENLLHDLDQVQFGTRMRGYDPTEVDALLERARREVDDLRTALRRAGERADLAEHQLSDELEAARMARAEAEAGIATAAAEASAILSEARAEAADLRAAADIEIRTAIQAGRTRMLDEVASLEAERDLLAEGIGVTAEHVAAHRDRLLRALEDMRAVLLDVEERPDPVRQPTPVAARPPAGPLETTVDQAAAAVTRLHPVAPLGGGVGGDDHDMNSFFADDGS